MSTRIKNNTTAAILGIALASSAIAATSTAHAADDSSKQLYYAAGTQGTFKGPEKWFTGDVYVQMLFPTTDTTTYAGAYVTFAPGARSAWHSHPAGQHMVVTSGVGLVGTRDGKITEIKAGDAIWCPPGVEHWHGARPDTAMTHLVITNSLDGKNAVWKEHVTDAQYLGK